jgi:hypothetical protein
VRVQERSVEVKQLAQEVSLLVRSVVTLLDWIVTPRAIRLIAVELDGWSSTLDAVVQLAALQPHATGSEAGIAHNSLPFGYHQCTSAQTRTTDTLSSLSCERRDLA